MASTVIELLSAEELRRTLNRLASQIIERAGDLNQLVLVGIQTRGALLAPLLAEGIGLLEGTVIPVGSLDITFYRDDLDRIGLKTPAETRIPVDLSGRTVILVDDVIYTGRTIRAAMDALSDYGRPAVMRLAVLIDRGHRELPIQPDFVGRNVPTTRNESVQLLLQSVDGRDSVELLKSETALGSERQAFGPDS
jgi:pyrimidine operon attenuation protein / uracil phosphoribosyltransferase